MENNKITLEKEIAMSLTFLLEQYQPFQIIAVVNGDSSPEGFEVLHSWIKEDISNLRILIEALDKGFVSDSTPIEELVMYTERMHALRRAMILQKIHEHH